MTKLLLSIAERLLNHLLPTKRPEPKVPPHPLPRDLLHIDRQIQAATRSYCVKCEALGRGLDSPLPHKQDCPWREPSSPRSLTPREDRIVGISACVICGKNEPHYQCEPPTSPRAITTRHAIPPPPPRKRR